MISQIIWFLWRCSPISYDFSAISRREIIRFSAISVFTPLRDLSPISGEKSPVWIRLYLLAYLLITYIIKISVVSPCLNYKLEPNKLDSQCKQYSNNKPRGLLDPPHSTRNSEWLQKFSGRKDNHRRMVINHVEHIFLCHIDDIVYKFAENLCVVSFRILTFYYETNYKETTFITDILLTQNTENTIHETTQDSSAE